MSDKFNWNDGDVMFVDDITDADFDESKHPRDKFGKFTDNDLKSQQKDVHKQLENKNLSTQKFYALIRQRDELRNELQKRSERNSSRRTAQSVTIDPKVGAAKAIYNSVEKGDESSSSAVEKFSQAQKKAYKDLASAASLSKKETAALKAYTSDKGYKEINAALRSGKNHPLMKDLDSVASAVTLKKDIIAYRGLLYGDGYKAGKPFTEKSYMSLSMDYDTAHSFSTGHADELAGSVVEFVIPAGTKIGFGKKSESEIILPRNTSGVLDNKKYVMQGGQTTILTGKLKKRAMHDAFNPDQPRDDHGRWWTNGNTSSTKKSSPPDELNGIPLKSWTPPDDWNEVEGQDHSIEEPALPQLAPGQHMASGVVMTEPDGRTWLTKPTDGYGGYWHSLPKGTIEDDMHPQANAIKEAYEETGLKARITGYIGDFKGDTSITRMYRAVRESGTTKDHGPESEAVVLAKPMDLDMLLNRSRDRKVIATATALHDEQWKEELHPRDKEGKFTNAGMINMQDLTKVSGKKGSNEGGVYKDKSGQEYYIKTPKSVDHVQNELTAAALYKAAGVNTMQYVPVAGGEHVATILQKLDKDNVAHFSEAERNAAQSDFAVHAWLANWDAAGTGGDNQVVVNGKVTTVDTGGSLRYRAQGEPKGADFGINVNEINTLRDPSKSPDAAALYGNMTNDQIKASIERVAAIPSSKINDIVYENMKNMSIKEKNQLADKLIARRNDLIAQSLNMTSASTIAPKTVAVAAAPAVKTPHDYTLQVKGTSAERVQWRKTLEMTKDPVERKELQNKIVASFAKAHANAKDASKKADLESKAAKYAKQYNVLNPITTPKPTAAKADEVISFAPATPKPTFGKLGVATQAELDKAKKNTKLTAQYVPGAPLENPEAQKLIDKFNEKYEGKVLTSHEDLSAKVAAFKKLQADMVPLMTEQQKQLLSSAEAQKNKMAAAKLEAAKLEAEKIANLPNLPEEEQRMYWLQKSIGGDIGNYMHSAHNAIAKHAYLQEAGVTPAEVGFIKAFTGPYSHVNAEMRDGYMSEHTFAFKHIMNDTLAKLPPHNGSTVYRKINLDPQTKASYVPGKIVHWKAFNSTSKNPDTWSGNTYFTIHNPKTGVDVQKISSNPSEAEVIMPADTYYKVLSKTEKMGKTHIEMEEVLPFGKKVKAHA